MYEPIRSKSLHTLVEPTTPRPAREEHLNAQLAGHLAALLTVTEQLGLDEAAQEIAARVAALSPQGAPALRREVVEPSGGGPAALHQRAHDLAGRVLVVAASRQDTATAMLACRRMEAHAQALTATPVTA